QAMVAAEKELERAKKGKDEEALNSAKNTLAKAQEDFDAYLNRFTTLEKQKREEEAKAADKRKAHATKIHEFEVKKAKLDATFQGIKAELDSKESLYYIAVDSKPADDPSIARLQNLVATLRERLGAAKVAQEENERALKASLKEVADAE